MTRHLDLNRLSADFNTVCGLTAVWAAAATGSRIVRPHALATMPAGYPEHDTIAWIVYRLFTHVPEGAVIMMAGFLAGAALAHTHIDNRPDAVADNRMRLLIGGILSAWVLTPLGAALPALSITAAGLLMWPTCAKPERADVSLTVVCAAGALGASAISLVNHWQTIAAYADTYGGIAADYTAWTSQSWNREVPWAWQAQAALATQSWPAWFELKSALTVQTGMSELPRYGFWLAASGLSIGLRTATTTPSTHWVFSPTALIIGAIVTGLTTTALESTNGWTGLGPRIAETLRAATALLAGGAVIAALRKRGFPRQRTAPMNPLESLAIGAAALAVGLAVVHLVPHWSPTPWNAGLHGELSGAATAAASLTAALAAAAAHWAATRLYDT